MTKYSFLVYHADYPNFIAELKKIGAVHVQPKENEPSPEMQELYRRISDVGATLRNLDTIKRNSEPPTAVPQFADGEALLARIREAEASLDKTRQHISALEKDERLAAPWGEYSHSLLHQLEDEGLTFRFMTVPVRKYCNEWETEYCVRKVCDVGGVCYFVAVERNEAAVFANADEVRLPAKTAAQLRNEIMEHRESEKALQTELNAIAHHKSGMLTAFHHQLSEELEEMNVVRQTTHEAEGKMMLVEGWAPDTHTSELNAYLESAGIVYIAQAPVAGEKTPVLLKNNRFARMFEFIGELYDLPNYHERDLTPFFAPFYVIFFGLCLGDAGYGLLFVLLGLFARQKVKEPVMKSAMSLISVLGGAAIVMGIVSGTFFGIPLLESALPLWISKFKAVMLDSNKLFYNALILGVVQILFGMMLKFAGEIKRSGFLSSLSTLGWLLLLIGCGGTYTLQAFNYITPEISRWSFIIFGSLGGACIFLLNNLRRNPLINAGAGLWDAYNMATGLLGDVLSYIRLFALGLSGGVMGLVFNDLALSMGSSTGIPVVSHMVTLFILLFGHGINIFIAALGSFVHPMRLTFVEFYKNAGFEGGGKKYKPFAKYKKETKVF
ncbi:MAG: hypothetical protein LBV41_03790 [Cytophagaceae bacterium]|nr:hypothetical protein [Cytophagaceae bacterium]